MEGFEREVIGERRVRGKKAPGVERLVLGTVDKGLTGTNTQNVHEVGSVGGGGGASEYNSVQVCWAKNLFLLLLPHHTSCYPFGYGSKINIVKLKKSEVKES